jgi:iron uptake system component EfeO
MKFRRATIGAAATTALLALTGCVANSPVESVDSATNVSVDSSADACVVSTDSAPSGTLSFTVLNSGTDVTEFYLLADDGLRIVGEVENIGPGIERTLVVQAQPGDYFTLCKPGLVGEGIGKSAFTVTDSGVKLSTGNDQGRIDAAVLNYVAYVQDQVEALVVSTDEFLVAYRAGNFEAARSLYASTRAYYERVEPVAESFGDLDPKLDFREADVEPGTEWTGWHRIEKDLWPPAAADNSGVAHAALTPEERTHFADLLAVDTATLHDAVHADDYTVTIDAISNGAIGLLDEVASGKITGEEEIWSHTDLWDFQGNLEGARVAYEGVRDIVESKNAELVTEIDEQFAALEAQLASYGSLETGFVYYDELTPDQIKKLADGVNALAEPLSRLTAALVG